MKVIKSFLTNLSLKLNNNLDRNKLTMNIQKYDNIDFCKGILTDVRFKIESRAVMKL